MKQEGTKRQPTKMQPNTQSCIPIGLGGSHEIRDETRAGETGFLRLSSETKEGFLRRNRYIDTQSVRMGISTWHIVRTVFTTSRTLYVHVCNQPFCSIVSISSRRDETPISSRLVPISKPILGLRHSSTNTMMECMVGFLLAELVSWYSQKKIVTILVVLCALLLDTEC